jgi:competence protein ComEA
MPAFLRSHWTGLLLRAGGWLLLLAGLAWLGHQSTTHALADVERPAERPAAAAPSRRDPPLPLSVVGVPTVTASALLVPACKAGAGDAFTADGKLILNRADADDLQKLPGIGKKRAEAIVALRQRLGRFRRVLDLLRIRGIGPRSLRRLRKLVVVDAPKNSPKPNG